MAAPRTSIEIAALGEKVSGVEKDYQELKGVVVGLSREMRDGFNLIHTKLDAQNRTPWIVIFSGFGVLLSVLGMVGWLAYSPIRDSQLRMDAWQLREAERVRELQTKQAFFEGVFRHLLK